MKLTMQVQLCTNVHPPTMDVGSWQALSHVQALVYLMSAIKLVSRLDVEKTPQLVLGSFAAVSCHWIWG